jgi:hypothetical protein
MAKIKDVTLSFPPSESSDVVGYKLYLETSPTEVTHDSPSHDLGNNTSILLNTILGTIDGIYNVGVVAIDDVGNESDFSLMSDIPLDFVPPGPPGSLTITSL